MFNSDLGSERLLLVNEPAVCHHAVMLGLVLLAFLSFLVMSESFSLISLFVCSERKQSPHETLFHGARTRKLNSVLLNIHLMSL